ncbi:hypothetical protein PFISCL1PPCAC_8660, partial [Pristionchus fissidentatus]
ETLSGIFAFRLEIFDTLRQFVNEEFNWIPFLTRLAHFETHLKQNVAEHYSSGKAEEPHVPAMEHTKASCPWWHESYAESADRFHNLEEKYSLMD